MTQNNGVSVPDRATAAEPEVSALRDGIANAEIRGQPVLHPWHSIADELLARGWSVEDLAIRMAIADYDTKLEEISVNMLTLDLYRTVGPNDHRCTIGVRAGTAIAKAFGVSAEMILGLDNDWRAAAKAIEAEETP